MLVQAVVKDQAVLHPAVHPLPVEGDHGVGCVPNDEGRGPHVVRGALHTDQRQCFVLEEVLDEFLLPDEGDGVLEVVPEKVQQGGLVVDAVEGIVGHEECEGKGPVLVRERDHHEPAPRPDVQVVLGHGEVPLRGGGDGELHVGVGDVLLGVVKPGTFHHFSSHSGVGAITTKDQVGVYNYLNSYSYKDKAIMYIISYKFNV